MRMGITKHFAFPLLTVAATFLLATGTPISSYVCTLSIINLQYTSILFKEWSLHSGGYFETSIHPGCMIPFPKIFNGLNTITLFTH